jgi:hypothetical protein
VPVDRTTAGIQPVSAANPRLPLVRLVGIGLSSAGVYALGLPSRYPLAAGLRSPGASWAVLAGFAPLATLLHAAVYGIATLIYVLALRLAGDCKLSGRTAQYQLLGVIVGVWLLCSIVLLGAYPGDSTDIFDYLFRGRMLAELGASPLATVPSRFADRPFYIYIHWTDNVDTYGPLWEYASWAVAALVGQVQRVADTNALVAYITGYRLLAIGLAGLCAVPIVLIVRYRHPEQVPAALVAWLWNPLLLTASAVGGHNDLLMLLAMLIALCCLQRRHWVWGLLALALAAHVKLTALLILPLLVLSIARRGGYWRAITACALALAATLPLSWLLYAPLGGWATLPRMLAERVRLLANSFAFVVYWGLQQFGGWQEVGAWRVTTSGATILFGLIAAGLHWRFWRVRAGTPEDADAQLWHDAALLTLVYLTIGSFWFQHWYILWALALAALLPERRLMQRVLPWWSLFALWLHLAVDFFLTPRPHGLAAPSGGIALLQLLAASALDIAWYWPAMRQRTAPPAVE